MSSNVNEILAYANVQMAAEALYGLASSQPGGTFSGELLTQARQAFLTLGNTRVSKFTTLQAEEFAEIWEVVEHKSNMTSGFSGTLFKVRAGAPAELLTRYGLSVGEQVLSFRSTEFADDAARDNQATNTLEIKEFGWALGQISDMRTWFESLQTRNLVNAPLTVTGYSLGGHLATAFNELFPTSVSATYTFNGAGVGNLHGSLDSVIDQLDALRNSQSALAARFTDPVVRQRFEELWPQFAAPGSIPELTTIASVNLLVTLHPQAQYLSDALQRMRSIGLEAQRVNNNITNTDGDPPADVALSNIAATSLGYQLAVLFASGSISPYRTSVAASGWAAISDRQTLPKGGANFYDIYGANNPSAVANSQWHYGQSTAVFVEDQPLLRGNVVLSSLVASAQSAEIKLLVNNFSSNDFGDTHSLVLLIDSLSVQAQLARLDPDLTLKRASEVFQNASHLKANSTFLQQGKAEGDVLENIVNALAAQLGITQAALRGNPDGNTWHDIDGGDTYDGRADLHERLKRIDEQITARDLQGQFNLTAASASTGGQARLDFGAYLALHTLSPFVLQAKDPAAQAALNTTWQQVHGDLYLVWASDKEAKLRGDSEHGYTVSDQWIADRATLLGALTRRGQVNEEQFVSDPNAPQDRNIEWHFVDPASAEADTFLWWNNTSNGADNALTSRARQRIAFGGQQADTLTGFDNVLGDRLYGAAGNDRLSGLGGADHLEGGSGSDALDGGAGNDTLYGGEGQDLYEFTSGHGQDVVMDADGLGSLVFNGQALEVGKRLSPDSAVWEDSTERYRITRIDASTLRINAKTGQDSITVKSWSDGNLGLVLGDEVEETEENPASLVYLGDQRARRHGIEVSQGDVEPDNPFWGHYAWWQTTWQPDGTLQGGVYHQDFADVIDVRYTSQGVSIFGFGGNDALAASAGADRIDGGEGDDLIGGGDGSDHIRGGAGHDVILSGASLSLRQRESEEDSYPAPAGSTLLVGGPTWRHYYVPDAAHSIIDTGGFNQGVNNSGAGQSEGDHVDAGDDDDLVFASHAADTVLGGQGADRLWGAGGGDYLNGGAEADYVVGDGINLADRFGYTPAEQHGNDLLDGGAGDDLLIGGGGSDDLLGGSEDDRLYGDNSSNNSEGALDGRYHGQDVLLGEAGHDELVGGGGNDTLIGGEGHDWLFGDDHASHGTDAGTYAVDAAWHGNDQLHGDAGNDKLVGGAGRDWLDGGTDNDVLHGDGSAIDASQHGNDTLLGGAGDDTLHGDGGDDTLDGGSGTNHLLGGAGNDTYWVKTADLAQATPAEGAPLNARTQISDSDGKNLLKIDALKGDITLQPTEGGGAGLGLRWSAGSGQVAALAFDSLDSAATFTVEFANGQRTTLARWMGDAFNVALQGESFASGVLLAGAAGNDYLSVYGAGASVMGGRGNDTLELHASNTQVHFDRGDGHDQLQGTGSAQRIAFGPGISAEHLSLRLTAAGQIELAIANADGSESGDRIALLPVWSWNLLGSNFLAGVDLADGSSLSWQQLLARGVHIEADPQAEWVWGTAAKDIITAPATGAALVGGEGDDEYHVGADANATIHDGEGRNRIVFSAQAASDWSAVSVQRAAPNPDGTPSNDLMLSVGSGAGGANIRLANALALGDRFELALADGRVASVASFVRALPALSVHGDSGNDHLLGSDGDDLLVARDGDDVLDGQGGSDRLLGGQGDDEYRINLLVAGQSQIADLQGSNVVRFAPGVRAADLQIERLGESTDLRLSLDAQRSLLVRRAFDGAVVRYEFADGTVWTPQNLLERLVTPDGQGINLSGSAHGNTLAGSPNADFIAAGAGNDVLSGFGGNDELHGGEGDDILQGGQGDDLLVGNEGDDEYRFELGDGVDRLIDPEGATRLRFGDGITLQTLLATRESIDGVDYLRVAYGTADAVLIRDDMPLDTLSFRFASGETRSAREVFAEILMGDGAPVMGSAGDDVLYGYAGADVLQGLAGTDTLHGGAGNDLLDGGAGSDHLHGGRGLDSYLLRAGAGLERIHEAPSQASRLVLEGMAPESLSFGRIGNDLLVHHAASGTSAFIQGAFQPGSQWTLVDAQAVEQDLLALASQRIGAQTAQEQQQMFLLAADAQAGPVAMGEQLHWMRGWPSFWTDESGTHTRASGTTLEKVYTLDRITRRIEHDEAVVEIGDELDAETATREHLYTDEVEETTWQTWVTHYDVTQTEVPARYVPIDEFIAGASGVELPPGASLVQWNGALHVYVPAVQQTVSVPVTESGWVTQTYHIPYYRDSFHNLRTAMEYVGGDSDNHVLLWGSANKTLSTGGGDDVVESFDEDIDDFTYEAVGAAERIDGDAGNDRLNSGTGDDELHGGLGSDHLNGGAGADVYVVDAQDDGWDVIDERAASFVYVEIEGKRFLQTPPAELWQALTEEITRHGGWVDGMNAQGRIPLRADLLNALMLLDTYPLAPPTSDGGRVDGYTAIYSAGLDKLIARTTGNPLDLLIDESGAQHPRPQAVFDDATLSQLKTDTVRFGPGVTAESLQVRWTTLSTDDGERRALSISWGGPGGVHVLMPDEDALPGVGIERFEFADGSQRSMADMLALAPAWPPVEPSVAVGQPIGALQVLEDGAWAYAIPADAFTHQGGQALRYELRLADGSAGLPAWLQFDPVAGTITGTPGNEAVGSIELRLSAVLDGTPPAHQTFTLQVLNTNDAPVLNVLDAVQLVAGQALDWTLGEGAFSDPDAGDHHTVGVALADGTALPAWLRFDPLTGRLHGTPAVSDIGELELRVRLQDAAGAWAEQPLRLSVGTPPGLHEVGTAGNDLLDGGLGADTLEGGLGNDTYLVNDAADRVVERRDQGHDSVISTVTHTLRAHVEDLELTGSANIHGTGNTLNNRLVGNAGNNTLNGGAGADTLQGGAGNDTLDGGSGADRLVGGLGDDTYIVERGTDLAVEAADEGIDTVQSSATYTLGEHIEHLVLTGAANRHGTGNALDNHLTGNGGNNKLSGGAGHDTLWGAAGSDTLIGGAGNDTYLLGRGDGAETVRENDSTSGNFDVMRFLQDVAIDQVWFRRVSNNLEVSIIGTGDKTTITNWYSGNQYKLEQFQVSDGQALANAQVDALVQAMAAFAPPPMGQTTLNNDQQAALAPVLAASWG